MSEDTKGRVLRVMAEMGYKPSRIAQQMRTGRANTVGLIVPSTANPFWGAWARAVESEALVRGYQLLLCNSARDMDREQEYVEDLWLSGVRSIILGSSLPSLKHLSAFVDRGMLLIAFDREPQPEDPDGIVSLTIDNLYACLMATRHLIQLGHRRIGYISGSIRTISRSDRFRGYRAALAQAHIPFDPELVWDDGSSGYGDLVGAEVGRRGVLALMSKPEPPTAVFATNDVCAIGACAGLREMGIDVPDVSVVGVDDIIFAKLYNPPLTTIRQPLERMAYAALDAIQAHQRKDSRSVKFPLFAPELIVRSSTRSPVESADHNHSRAVTDD